MRRWNLYLQNDIRLFRGFEKAPAAEIRLFIGIIQGGESPPFVSDLTPLNPSVKRRGVRSLCGMTLPLAALSRESESGVVVCSELVFGFVD